MMNSGFTLSAAAIHNCRCRCRSLGSAGGFIAGRPLHDDDSRSENRACGLRNVTL